MSTEASSTKTIMETNMRDLRETCAKGMGLLFWIF
jgi:hypothetical protein